MKKMKLLINMFLILSLFAFQFACSKDKENDEPNIPTNSEDVDIQSVKENAVKKMQDCVNSLDKNLYSNENWSKIQNFLVDYSKEVFECSTTNEISLVVKNFETLIGLVEILPPKDVTEGEDVSEEVWSYIEQSLEAALNVNNFKFEYDASIPSLGLDANKYLKDMNIDFKGVIDNENGEYYITYDNKASGENKEKFEAWIIPDDVSKLKVVYADIENSDLNGKYIITAEKMTNFIFEEYFGIDTDQSIKIPVIGKEISVMKIFDYLVSENEAGKEDATGIFEGYGKEVVSILKESLESKMWIINDKTTVNVYVNKDEMSEKNPNLEDVLTTDLDINIELENNKLTKIAIKPVVEETTLPDDPADIEEKDFSLSLVEEIKFLFENDKITSGYIWIEALNNLAAIGVRFEYAELELPEFTKEEFDVLDIGAFLSEREFKAYAGELITLYSLYWPQSLLPNNDSFEEFVGKNVDEDFIVYLINNNNLKLYRTDFDNIDNLLDITTATFYVKSGEYLGKLMLPQLKVELTADLAVIESLIEIEFDYLKIIEAYSNKQSN